MPKRPPAVKTMMLSLAVSAFTAGCGNKTATVSRIPSTVASAQPKVDSSPSATVAQPAAAGGTTNSGAGHIGISLSRCYIDIVGRHSAAVELSGVDATTPLAYGVAIDLYGPDGTFETRISPLFTSPGPGRLVGSASGDVVDRSPFTCHVAAVRKFEGRVTTDIYGNWDLVPHSPDRLPPGINLPSS